MTFDELRGTGTTMKSVRCGTVVMPGRMSSPDRLSVHECWLPIRMSVHENVAEADLPNCSWPADGHYSLG